MAKLDDFGRPIYETAEEYNKAHRGGVCPRPYDNPEGANYGHNTGTSTERIKSMAYRHATVQGSKRLKSSVVVVAAFFLIVNVLIIIATLSSIGFMDHEIIDQEVIQNNWNDGYYVDTEFYTSDIESPLIDGFETFCYNGVVCSIPTSLDEIMEIGLNIQEYDIDEAFPSEYEEIISLVDDDGNLYAMVRVSNYTGEEIAIGKCMVDYFYVVNPDAFEELDANVDFTFGDGLTFESTYEDFERYFGVPCSLYDSHYTDGSYYEHYEWCYYGDEECHYVVVIFCDDVLQNIPE